MTAEETQRVESAFERYLGGPDRMAAFTRAVRDHHALVAGGSIVAAFGHYPIHDLDLYVHRSDAESFLAALCSAGIGMHVSGCHMASEYDQSFFRKNHISVRFPLKKKKTTTTHAAEHEILMDVMVIPDTVPVTQVVTNFDLTFCEAWWEGRTVFAVDPEGLREKRGALKPDYHAALLRDANPFILRRILKYRDRGFAVDLSRASLSDPLPNPHVTGKTIADEPSWATKQCVIWLLDQFETLQRAAAAAEDAPVSTATLYFRACPPEHQRNAAGFAEWIGGSSADTIEVIVGLTYMDRVGRFFPEPYQALFLREFPRAADRFRNRCASEAYHAFYLGDLLWPLLPFLDPAVKIRALPRFHEGHTWHRLMFSTCACDLCHMRRRAFPSNRYPLQPPK